MSVTGAELLERDLTRWAGVQPDRVAVTGTDGSRLTYAELESRSNQVAHLFRSLGLRRGDHVALLSENRVDLFPVVLAAQRTGLLYTPVNWHLTADEARYIVDNCGARVLVASVTLGDLAASVDAPGLTHRISLGGAMPGYDALADLVAGRPETPVADQAEGYYMLYSSGTTGRPKGILPQPADNRWGEGITLDQQMAAVFGFSPATVYLSPGPLYHAAPLGWCLGTIRNGGTVVMMERFDAEDALRLIGQHRVTHSQFVPTMFVRMLKLPEEVRRTADVSSLQLVVHAAAPCPVAVKHAMIEWWGPKLLEFYAGSEGTGFFLIDSPTWLERPGSVGRPLIGGVHICDDAGRELPPGEVGTVWFSDITPFEYHLDPEKTRAAFNELGWNTLGDLGHLDEEGFLFLSDRRTDLIVSGGVNIYPREVEDVLVVHPEVADVAVVGLPDEEYGQRVHAVVSPAGGVDTDGLEERLTAYLRDRVAGFKLPRSWSFEDVPRLPSGKILRREILRTGVAR